MKAEIVINVFIIALLITILGVVIAIVINETKCSHFTNKASGGYYYDTDNMRFTRKEDRDIAISQLASQMTKSGISVSESNLKTVPDLFIIQTLEAEDDTEQLILQSRIVMMIDPTYKSVFASVIQAQRNNFRFNNQDERMAVFNLLMKYFQALKSPINSNLSKWTDFVLIRTFRTLKPPSYSELGK